MSPDRKPPQFKVGRDWEEVVISSFRKGLNVREVLLQPLTDDEVGMTVDGKPLLIRIDIVRLNGDKWRFIECKSSQTAPLTRNQKIGFPQIEKYGARVCTSKVHSISKDSFIPPTKVEIVRPEHGGPHQPKKAVGPNQVCTLGEIARTAHEAGNSAASDAFCMEAYEATQTSP